MTISVCMIVKNEEPCIERCLSSVKDFVDEIVIVDTGSTDRTKELAKRFTDKIFDFKWNDDFSTARNFSISKATSDWILILDADEAMDPESMKKILSIIDKNDCDAIFITQRNYTNNETEFEFVRTEEKNKYTQEYKGYAPYQITRIFKRKPEIYFEDRVHETVGTSIYMNKLKTEVGTDIIIHHYGKEKGEKNVFERQMNYLRLAERTLKDNPEDARAHYFVASISAIYLHDNEKAIEHTKLAYKYGFDPERCLLGLGAAFSNTKRYDEALETFKEAESKGFSNPILFYNLANLYYLKKDYVKSKNYFEKFVKYDHPLRQNALDSLDHVNKLANNDKVVEYYFSF